MISKKELRARFRRKRDQLCKDRHAVASQQLSVHFDPLTLSFPYILSYASFGSELDTSLLNKQLLSRKQLVLPKIVDDNIELFHVEHPETQLKRSIWGIWEPLPELCTQISHAQIGIVVVPGLGFDQDNHRLGYGRGFYDRLLVKFPPKTKKFGIGFKEQLHPHSFPTHEQDVSLDEIIVF